jgi:hypothetical protein
MKGYNLQLNHYNFLFFLSQSPLLKYNIHDNTQSKYNSLIREGFLLGPKPLKQLLPSNKQPYNERSILTTKLQYFTRKIFPIFHFGGIAHESPAMGATKIVTPPPS